MKENILLVGANGSIGSEIYEFLRRLEYDVIKMVGKDVTNISDVDSFFSDDKNLKIAHLIYCVSAPIEFKNFIKTDFDDFQKHFDVQVKGLYLILKKIINNKNLKSVQVIGSSILFGRPSSKLASYTVAKYALLGFCRSLIAELASQKIRINLISPGLTGKGLSSIYPNQLIELTNSQTPLGHLVTNSDIANLIKFLISDEAKYITGLNIPVDGGVSI